MVAVAADLSDPPQQSEMFGHLASSQTAQVGVSITDASENFHGDKVTCVKIEAPQIVLDLLEVVIRRNWRLEPLWQSCHFPLLALRPDHECS